MLGKDKYWSTCRADWAAWPSGTCQAGRLVRRPGGPPRHMLQEGVDQRSGPGALRYGGGVLFG